MIEALPGGAMVAVRMDEGRLATVARPGALSAAVNTPSLCVLSGPLEVVEGLEADLARRGSSIVVCRPRTRSIRK